MDHPWLLARPHRYSTANTEKAQIQDPKGPATIPQLTLCQSPPFEPHPATAPSNSDILLSQSLTLCIFLSVFPHVLWAIAGKCPCHFQLLYSWHISVSGGSKLAQISQAKYLDNEVELLGLSFLHLMSQLPLVNWPRSLH